MIEPFLQCALCHPEKLFVLTDDRGACLNHFDGRAGRLQHVVQVVHDAGQELADGLSFLRTLGDRFGQTLRSACDIELAFDLRRRGISIALQLLVNRVCKLALRAQQLGLGAQAVIERAQRLLRLAPFGDIAIDRQHRLDMAVGSTQRVCRHQPEVPVAIVGSAFGFKPLRFATRRRSERLFDPGPEFFRPQRCPLFADDGVRIARRDPGQAVRVDEYHAAIERNFLDGIQR